MVVTENGLDTFTDWLELASPDFFTQLEALLSSDAEKDEEEEDQ